MSLTNSHLAADPFLPSRPTPLTVCIHSWPTDDLQTASSHSTIHTPVLLRTEYTHSQTIFRKQQRSHPSYQRTAESEDGPTSKEDNYHHRTRSQSWNLMNSSRLALSLNHGHTPRGLWLLLRSLWVSLCPIVEKTLLWGGPPLRPVSSFCSHTLKHNPAYPGIKG